MTDTCRTCRFWKANPPSEGQEGINPAVCRRHPVFVPRAHSDWCGDWEERLDIIAERQRAADILYSEHLDAGCLETAVLSRHDGKRPACQLESNYRKCPVYQGGIIK